MTRARRPVVYRSPASGDAPARKAAAVRLQEDPNDPDAMFAVAAFLVANGHLQKADTLLARLAELDPEYPGLWRFRAWVCAVLGRLWLAELCEARADAADAS